MDEIHAVLELFVSCRGSGWPLVRVDAVRQLLTQHLLMAAPMDKEEVADMIKTCFEADNNGEINFLSFWAGMENLLELLGLRDQGAYVDDKVYGLQVFRDGLLAEALRKHEGPTSGVLLTRDEVLHIIDATNKSVTSRHDGTSSDDPRSRQAVEAGNHAWSSPFWDEVYRETQQLDPSSVLSISELSMMVFGFLKTYIQENSQVRGDFAEQVLQNESSVMNRRTESPVRASRSGASSVSEGDCAPHTGPLGTSLSDASREHAEDSHRRGFSPEVPAEALHEAGYTGDGVALSKRWQGKSDEERLEAQEGTSRRGNSEPGAGYSMFEGSVSNLSSEEQSTSASRADAVALLKAAQGDHEDPRAQLRQLLLVAARITKEGSVSKKAVQELRYLNAAAVDCLDRLSVEHDKRNDETSDAALSLRRMRTEKQQLVERLTSLEHQHSQLQLQHEQQACDREQLGQLKAALSAERQEKERFEHLFRDKQDEAQRVSYENEKLLEQLNMQSEDFARRRAAMQKEQIALAAEHERKTESLIREKELLEEQLRSAEDTARAAEAARKQLQGDADSNTFALRQRILELEEEKRRYEAEAEENDTLITQLQGRLEEKVQQVTILEVKNKQQLRMLQQVRSVRNSLMQLLQEAKGKEDDAAVSQTSGSGTAQQSHELLKLRAGLKTAQAHIKELETFVDEMRKEQRRAAHPRYDWPAAGGDSSAPPTHRWQVARQSSLPVRALPTLGAELEMSGTASSPKSLLERADRDTGRLMNAVECSALKVPDVLADEIAEAGNPLDLVNSDGSPEAESVQTSYREDRRAPSARAALRSSSLDRTTLSPTPDSQAVDLRAFKPPAGSASSPHLPASRTFRENPSQNERASTALEILLGGRRRLSRRSSNSSAGQQQRASAATSSVLSLPDLHAEPAEPAEPVPGSSRESNFLSDSRGSAASDGSFLMLSSPKGSVPSPSGASRKHKSHRPAQELTNRPLDAGALSNMFGMLGACAPLPSYPPDRAVRQADVGQQKPDKVRNADERQDSEPGTPKSRSKQPARLSAAAAAAMSSRDVSGFRSLKRITHGSEYSADREKERGGPASALVYDNNTRRRSSGGEDAFDTARSDALHPPGSTADSPKSSLKSEQLHDAAPNRARRTVSRGLSGVAAKRESSPEAQVAFVGSLQHKGLDASSKQSGLTGAHVLPAGQQDTEMSMPVIPITSRELNKRGQSETVGVRTGGTSASRRGREEGLGEVRDFLEGEPCRSVGLSHSKRNARSRSSSPDSSLRRQPSPRGGTVGQKHREPPVSNKKEEAKDTGKSQESYGTSKSSQHADNRSEDPTSARPPTSSATVHRETDGLSIVKQREQASEHAEHGQEMAIPFTLHRSTRSTSTQATPVPQRQHAVSQDRVKLQDDQTASAAALLAAAAGVVDASLQQQQQMIQRQHEHHEDLQRVQQRRIDMLQEQLESLQRSKEQQRETGEQQQRQIIESLQAKLEELQRRQEQRDHEFQEAQRKLLQEELQTQLQQKFAELQGSPGSTNLDATSPLSKIEFSNVHANGLGVSTCGGKLPEPECSLVTATAGRSSDGFHGEPNLQAVRLQEGDWNGAARVHAPCANTSRKPPGGSIACVNSALPSRRRHEDALNAIRWHRGEEGQFGGAGHLELRRGGDFQRQLASSISRVSENDDATGDFETSSCASSSIMGSQYGVMCQGNAVEDMPTTASSPFLSQAATPGARSSLSSQRAAHFAAAQKRDSQAPALRGERLTPQLLQAHSLESAHYKGPRVRRQPSESTVGSHQHSTISSSFADPSLFACGVQRTSSSTGSLWSPKASKSGAGGLREPSGGSKALIEPLYHAATFSSGGGDASFRRDFRRGSGGLPLPPNTERRSGDSGAATGRPPLSAFHPVSRAERVALVPQTPVDSARFLGSSGTSEKAASRSESFRCPPSTLSSQETHLKYPPASARSFVSTSSYATAPVQKMVLPKTSRIGQRSKCESESSLPSADFLALTTARSAASRPHTDSRSSQATTTKRATHSSCEGQAPPSPGRQSTQSGRRRTRSPASVTGRDSLVAGSRRTVNPLMSKLTRSSASDVQSPRAKDTAASSVIDSELRASAHRESLKTQRFESSEAAAAYYRRSTTSEALPEAELPRPVSQHRRKTRLSSSRKSKAESGAQIDESGQAEKSRDSKSSSSLALDWSGFNGGFMSQVQKWIS
ncbi:hypothetical protein ACSSS7_003082 [Eimeria intestinalis]